jgi:hypothetical protein
MSRSLNIIITVVKLRYLYLGGQVGARWRKEERSNAHRSWVEVLTTQLDMAEMNRVWEVKGTGWRFGHMLGLELSDYVLNNNLYVSECIWVL